MQILHFYLVGQSCECVLLGVCRNWGWGGVVVYSCVCRGGGEGRSVWGEGMGDVGGLGFM